MVSAARVKVISVSRSDDGTRRYYLNDGLYGSFNCLLYDHATVRDGPFLLNDVGGREIVDGAFFGHGELLERIPHAVKREAVVNYC